ncbi:hypothetical protein pdam_00001963, partial [Pocillopora damicornis]
MALWVRFGYKLVRFSPGALRCCCEAVKLFDFYDAQTRSPNVCYLLDHSKILLFKVLTLITIVFLEFLPCSGLIFCFASMYYIVYKHERAARILAKQLRYNQIFLLRIKEKAAVKIM